MTNNKKTSTPKKGFWARHIQKPATKHTDIEALNARIDVLERMIEEVVRTQGQLLDNQKLVDYMDGVEYGDDEADEVMSRAAVWG